MLYFDPVLQVPNCCGDVEKSLQYRSRADDRFEQVNNEPIYHEVSFASSFEHHKVKILQEALPDEQVLLACLTVRPREFLTLLSKDRHVLHNPFDNKFPI